MSLVPLDPRDAEAFRALDILARSSLADIPQFLITPEQRERVLAGEKVEPTASQLRGARRVAGERDFQASRYQSWKSRSWRARPLMPKLLRGAGARGAA